MAWSTCSIRFAVNAPTSIRPWSRCTFAVCPRAISSAIPTGEIARHLRLLAGLAADQLVDVAVYPLASQTFELAVVGVDHSGTLACITAALAAYGFDLDDVQISPYLEDGAGPQAEPRYFVIVLRVSGTIPGRSLTQFMQELRGRLRLAFGHLAQGNLLEAQTAAADTRALASVSASTAVDFPVAPAGRPPATKGSSWAGIFACSAS
jgi:hypothetical protein